MIRSQKLRKHAKGKPCTLRFGGCLGGGETTVLAHIRDSNKGMGIKASDLSACYACASCHDLLDHHPHLVDYSMRLWHQLRALQETLEILVADNVIIVPQDVETKMMDKPVKARKPKEQRTKIQSRGFPKRTKDVPGEDTVISHGEKIR